jgi:hypothetical protein
VNSARSRPRRFSWAFLATKSIVALHFSWSSETRQPPSATQDASADTFEADDGATGGLDAIAVDSRDSDIIACTPGEEPRPCAAVLTGCPSFTVCSERFGLRCPCRSCTWTLEPGVCSWMVTVENPGLNIVERVGIDGGRPQRLQQVEPGPCGDDEFGFFVTRVPGTTTVTLCPASCTEHEDDPTLTFTLDRGPCPPS